jgi:serine protease Do
VRRLLSTTICLVASLAACFAACPAAAEAPADPRAARRTPAVEVFQRNREAVVYVTGPLVQGEKPTTGEFFAVPSGGEEKTSLGSGFVIHPAGYVLTNAHAAEKVISHEVTMADGRKVAAELLALCRRQDLALLKIDAGQALSAVRLGKAGDVMTGETVIVIANPHGLLHTCTAGVVSAIGRSTSPSGLPGVTLHGLLQTDAGINPGSSGGPWFNVLGEVMGITTSRKAESDNIGFAVPAAAIRKELPAMIDAQRRCGLVTGFSVADEGPAKVVGVEADSPAAKAGLAPGDVLARLGGRAIEDRADLELALVGRKPGDSLALEAVREGKPLVASLVPGSRPKPDGAALLTAKFGLTPGPLDQEKAKVMLLRIAQGVVIREVDVGRYAGVKDPPKPGDVLVSIDRIRPRDVDHLGFLVETIAAGQKVAMVILRKDGDVCTRIDLTTVAQ